MIVLTNIKKSFGEKQVLQGVTFNIQLGETLAIIGKSGSGKSVLFKLIVGLLTPDEGSISIEDKRIDEMTSDELYAVRRSIGYVFQNAALLDSMNVYENLILGQYEHGLRDEVKLKNEVIENLCNVGLLPDINSLSDVEFQKQYSLIATKKPSELSGGMRKELELQEH